MRRVVRRGRAALLPVLVAVLSISLACGKPVETPAAKLETDDQKAIYALGLAMSRNLAPFALSESELAVFERGVRDGALARPTEVSLEDWGPKIQTFMQARTAAAAMTEQTASSGFLAAAAEEPGASRLESGLIFRELAPGSGASPASTDTVRVHYRGTLRDGSVFDSSIDRGQPAQFSLNRVIPCWTEGVGKLKVGGKAKLTCPAKIAYGDRGSPPMIKPGAALAFEVELVEIVASGTASPSPH